MNSHSIEVIPSIKVRDKDGLVIRELNLEKDTPDYSELELIVRNPGQPEQIHKQPFRSWVENFGKILGAGMTGGLNAIWNVNWKSTAGVLQGTNVTNHITGPALSALAGSLYGIMVGASAGSTTTSAFQLKVLITSGTNPGQLVYGASTADVPAYVSAAPNSSVFKYTLRRTFTNNSTSADTTIREVGLYAQGTPIVGNQLNGPYMIARDILDASGNPLSIIVANGGGHIEIRYNFYYETGTGLQTPFLRWLYGCAYGAVAPQVVIPTTQNAFGSTASTTSIAFGSNLGAANTNQSAGNNLQAMFCTPGSPAAGGVNGNAGSGNAIGIVFGASSTVTSTSGQDANLASKYPQGNTYGFLDYQGTNLPNIANFGNCVTSSTGTMFYMERQAINAAPFAQTIQEIGIIAGGGSGGTANCNFIMYRKVIPAVTLQTGQSIDVGISFQYPVI